MNQKPLSDKRLWPGLILVCVAVYLVACCFVAALNNIYFFCLYSSGFVSAGVTTICPLPFIWFEVLANALRGYGFLFVGASIVLIGLPLYIVAIITYLKAKKDWERLGDYPGTKLQVTLFSVTLFLSIVIIAGGVFMVDYLNSKTYLKTKGFGNYEMYKESIFDKVDFGLDNIKIPKINNPFGNEVHSTQ